MNDAELQTLECIYGKKKGGNSNKNTPTSENESV